MENDELESEELDEFESDETDREIVVPGEVLTEDVEHFNPGRGTLLNREKNKIISFVAFN